MRGSVVVWLTCWATLLSSSCSPAAPPVPAARREKSAVRAKPAVPIESVRPTARRPGPPPIRGRNPFTFGSAAAEAPTSSLPPLPPPEGLPELPLPLPQPAVRLLGITTGREQPPVRTAVLSVAGELVLAKVGDAVAGRYRVESIGDDAVELLDPSVQDRLRLPLR
jgi:hypothetical protein